MGGRRLSSRRFRPSRVAGARPAVDGDKFFAIATAGIRSRSRLRAGQAHRRIDRHQCPLGGRRSALLERRSRGMHQWPHRRRRRLFRYRRLLHCREADRRAPRGWRLELRTVQRLHSVVLCQHHQRAGRAAGVRASDRWYAAIPGGAQNGRGIPAQARPLPASRHRRASRRTLPAPPAPEPLALRHPPRPRLFPVKHPPDRLHPRSAPRRGDRPSSHPPPSGRQMAARLDPARARLVRDRRGEGQPSRWITLRAMRVLRWWNAPTARSNSARPTIA